MIKSEQLRIGDIVTVSNEKWKIKKGDIYTVIGIDWENHNSPGWVTLASLVDYRVPNTKINCDSIEGTPLTPEILKQNDFEDKDLGAIFTKAIDSKIRCALRRVSIVHYPNEWGVFLEYESWHDSVLLRFIQYVHELQHIFWALGMDTEIKL